jgi:hypothetical protein
MNERGRGKDNERGEEGNVYFEDRTVKPTKHWFEKGRRAGCPGSGL